MSVNSKYIEPDMPLPPLPQESQQQPSKPLPQSSEVPPPPLYLAQKLVVADKPSVGTIQGMNHQFTYVHDLSIKAHPQVAHTHAAESFQTQLNTDPMPPYNSEDHFELLATRDFYDQKRSNALRKLYDDRDPVVLSKEERPFVVSDECGSRASASVSRERDSFASDMDVLNDTYDSGYETRGNLGAPPSHARDLAVGRSWSGSSYSESEYSVSESESHSSAQARLDSNSRRADSFVQDDNALSQAREPEDVTLFSVKDWIGNRTQRADSYAPEEVVGGGVSDRARQHIKDTLMDRFGFTDANAERFFQIGVGEHADSLAHLDKMLRESDCEGLEWFSNRLDEIAAKPELVTSGASIRHNNRDKTERLWSLLTKPGYLEAQVALVDHFGFTAKNARKYVDSNRSLWGADTPALARALKELSCTMTIPGRTLHTRAVTKLEAGLKVIHDRVEAAPSGPVKSSTVVAPPKRPDVSEGVDNSKSKDKIAGNGSGAAENTVVRDKAYYDNRFEEDEDDKEYDDMYTMMPVPQGKKPTTTTTKQGEPEMELAVGPNTNDIRGRIIQELTEDGMPLEGNPGPDRRPEGSPAMRSADPSRRSGATPDLDLAAGRAVPDAAFPNRTDDGFFVGEAGFDPNEAGPLERLNRGVSGVSDVFDDPNNPRRSSVESSGSSVFDDPDLDHGDEV